MQTRTIIAALAVASAGAFASSAGASLNGTPLTATITHTGVGWSLVGNAVVPHTYGGSPSIFTSMWYGSFLLASPAAAPGYDNALLVDFSLFNYVGFATETGTISVTGLSENIAPGSIAIFSGTAGIGPNIASNVSNGVNNFTASWSAAAIYTPSAGTPDAMVVAWNSAPAPAPGALALLGAAGLVGTGRRRRR
jgi:hypothetical protein